MVFTMLWCKLHSPLILMERSVFFYYWDASLGEWPLTLLSNIFARGNTVTPLLLQQKMGTAFSPLLSPSPCQMLRLHSFWSTRVLLVVQAALWSITIFTAALVGMHWELPMYLLCQHQKVSYNWMGNLKHVWLEICFTVELVYLFC